MIGNAGISPIYGASAETVQAFSDSGVDVLLAGAFNTVDLAAEC
ncbi:hypothetical protein QNA24_34605 [Rhodococcus qingshengii]|nr:hypothetical protein [Rhodococcus qingshengii]MDJ0491507.1 hypothetical protein [Rhodococcus qingshengii]